MLHPKVKAATGGGALGAFVAWAASRGIHITTAEAGTIATILAALAGYLKSGPAPVATGATETPTRVTPARPTPRPAPRPHHVPHPRIHHTGNARGLWVWNDTNARGVVRDAASAGIGWITVKVQDGTSRFNSHALIEEYRALCKQHNLLFGVWAYVRGSSPVTEASLAAALVRQYGAAFFIADAEIEVEQNPGPVSKIFTRTFRASEPHLSAHLSSFGRVDLHPGIDWWAWKREGFGFMPQAYFVDSRQLDPGLCVEAARHIWHPREMQPTVSAQSDSGPRASALSLGRSVERLGVYGANLWSAEIATHDD